MIDRTARKLPMAQLCASKSNKLEGLICFPGSFRVPFLDRGQNATGGLVAYTFNVSFLVHTFNVIAFCHR